MVRYPSPKARTFSGFKNSIEAAWRDVKAAFLGVGDLLCAAKKELAPMEFRDLLDSLTFSRRTAERLMAIARDPRLRASDMQKKLPSCWGTVYELHTLNDSQLNEIDRAGLIHTGIQRKEVIAFKRRKKPGLAKVKSAERVVLSLTVRRSFADLG